MEALAVAANVDADGGKGLLSLRPRSPITTPADVWTARGGG
jgi:hypothetical protein